MANVFKCIANYFYSLEERTKKVLTHMGKPGSLSMCRSVGDEMRWCIKITNFKGLREGG